MSQNFVLVLISSEGLKPSLFCELPFEVGLSFDLCAKACQTSVEGLPNQQAQRSRSGSGRIAFCRLIHPFAYSLLLHSPFADDKA